MIAALLLLAADIFAAGFVDNGTLAPRGKSLIDSRQIVTGEDINIDAYLASRRFDYGTSPLRISSQSFVYVINNTARGIEGIYQIYFMGSTASDEPPIEPHPISLQIEFSPGVTGLRAFGHEYTINGNTLNFSLPPIVRGANTSVFVRFTVPQAVLAGIPRLVSYSWNENADDEVHLSGGSTENIADINFSAQPTANSFFTDALIKNAEAAVEIGMIYYDRNSGLDDYTRLSLVRNLIADSLQRISVARTLAGENTSVFANENSLFSMYNDICNNDLARLQAASVPATPPPENQFAPAQPVSQPVPEPPPQTEVPAEVEFAAAPEKRPAPQILCRNTPGQKSCCGLSHRRASR
jgi:hypothetical protein